MQRGEYLRMYQAEECHWWYVGLHRLILKTVAQESSRLGRPLEIFDAGCGTGRLSQLLVRQGHRVSGCDVSEESLRFCRLRGLEHMSRSDLNHIRLEPGRYDVITSIDVLYHAGVSDDTAVMGRLREGLVPGGMLILQLPAFEFLRSTHDVAVHTRERYSKRMICCRLHDAGFSCIRTGYRVGFLFPLIAVYRVLMRIARRGPSRPDEVISDVSVPHPFINALLLKIIDLENRMLERYSLPVGSSLFVTARRPPAPEDP